MTRLCTFPILLMSFDLCGLTKTINKFLNIILSKATNDVLITPTTLFALRRCHTGTFSVNVDGFEVFFCGSVLLLSVNQ